MLDKLNRYYKEAIAVFTKAAELDPDNLTAYSSLAEIYYDLGNLDEAYRNIKEALNIDENHVHTLSLQGRIYIENKEYENAGEIFKKAVSLDIGNTSFLFMEIYSNYLYAEYSIGPKNERYQEELSSIIRRLEKIEKLTGKDESVLMSYILYFQGCFYFKLNDVFAAKEKLEQCMKLKCDSPIKKYAHDLLSSIWNFKIKPRWWLWWLSSPLLKWPKRIVFFALCSAILAMLVFQSWLKLDPTPYVIILALLLFILLTPNAERLKAKDIEIDLLPPAPFEPVLSPLVMESKIKEIEKLKTGRQEAVRGT